MRKAWNKATTLISYHVISVLKESKPTKDDIPVKQGWRVLLSHRQTTRQNDPNRCSSHRHPSVFLHGQKRQGRLTKGET